MFKFSAVGAVANHISCYPASGYVVSLGELVNRSHRIHNGRPTLGAGFSVEVEVVLSFGSLFQKI